jgi:hypothetical protein
MNICEYFVNRKCTNPVHTFKHVPSLHNPFCIITDCALIKPVKNICDGNHSCAVCNELDDCEYLGI